MALADLFRLDGRIALVTGASSPIGAAISEAFAEAGATVICAARNVAKGQATADRIGSAGGKAIALPLDLADEASIVQVHKAAREQVGIVDTLVHNAMSQLPGHVEGYPREKWEASMAVDGTGYFRMTQIFLEDMLQAGRGNIITIASILGIVALNAKLYPNRGGLDSFHRRVLPPMISLGRLALRLADSASNSLAVNLFSLRSYRAFAASGAWLFVLAIASANAAPPPFFKNGDVVALVGGEDLVAAAEDGSVESALLLANPGVNLSARGPWKETSTRRICAVTRSPCRGLQVPVNCGNSRKSTALNGLPWTSRAAKS